MARSILLLYSLSRRQVSESVRGYFFFVPTGLALITSFFLLFYISSTSNLFFLHPPHIHKLPFSLRDSYSPISPILPVPFHHTSLNYSYSLKFQEQIPHPLSNYHLPVGGDQFPLLPKNVLQISSNGEENDNNAEVFHDRDIFMENYAEMNRSLKIYIYPHRQDDPFANVLLPVDFQPGGNYASESYFKKAITNSHFITEDPSEAHFFYLPFSIARLRHDPRVGIEGIQDFIRDYVYNISHKYPYWNRSCGADHFYVACHSIGRSALNKASQLKFNAIQIVCSSSYFVSSYVAHKDVSLPQIWPRHEGDYSPANADVLASSKRKQLAFFAGSINSPVREMLVRVWGNDSEISVNLGRLKSSYTEALMGSKFCLHVKGFEVNTARIGDALFYGCVPVIIANHYDLPFQDVLDWKSFSIVVATLDIPKLKQVLRGVSYDEYMNLQRNVLKVRKHFQWHVSPIDFDAFYMVMYELWLRRISLVRVPF